jgi:anti-anti-sigma factor
MKSMERLETKITTDEPGRLVVSLIGELDLGAADGLWNSLEPLLNEKRLIVLDGESLEFLDSSGLRVLARAANRAKETQITLRLVAPNPAVRRTLELAGAEELIELYPTVAQALA